MDIKIKEIAYHRNGICGEPFNVILFDWEDGDKTRHMMGILPCEYLTAKKTKNCGRCYVLDVDETAQGNIAFAEGNSWRGDHFEADLWAAVNSAPPDTLIMKPTVKANEI